jgi:hypothetical protein
VAAAQTGFHMMTRLLSATEFLATFSAPMRDVLSTATNVIDIWPYVAAIPACDLSGNDLVDGCVAHAYRNSDSTFDHVLVVTGAQNVFLVVVADLTRDCIVGHHLLDLNREYGLAREGRHE